MSMLSQATILGLCAFNSIVQGHMQMIYPIALDSTRDPANPNPDYSMTNPLNQDGSNFPCKNYQSPVTYAQTYTTQATWTAGRTYNMTLNGTANHHGGSCQLSLSYDNGVIFKVIQSMIGGCPVTPSTPDITTPSFNFTIPSFAPASSSVLLAWTWFNLLGAREMYMNCARVQIKTVTASRHRRAFLPRQAASSIDSLPDLFTCNIGNGCTSIERQDVQFLNPGDNVRYGQDLQKPEPGTGYFMEASQPAPSTTSPNIPTSTPPFINTTSADLTSYSPPLPPVSMISRTTVTSSSLIYTISRTTLAPNTTTSSSWVYVTPSTTLSQPVSTASVALGTSPASLISSITFSKAQSIVSTTLLTTATSKSTTWPGTTSTTALPATNSTVTQSPSATSIPPFSASPNPLGGPCTPGTFACNNANSFSQCSSSGTYIYMGSVAAGMKCVNGVIIRESDGPCTPNGQIFCQGSTLFYKCDQGGLIDMGPLAPATTCVGDVIQR